MSINEAAAEFTRRKNRTEHPAGSFDRAGRWFPADGERCDCCASLRTPSRAFPYSLMLHCRTAAHIAAKYGLDALEIKREAKKL